MSVVFAIVWLLCSAVAVCNVRLPAFQTHCPVVYEALMKHLSNFTAATNASSDSAPRPFPFLLHDTGPLHPASQHTAQRLIAAKAALCQRHPRSPSSPTPVIVGLSNGTELLAGHTHAFLVDDGSCQASTAIFRATMAAAHSRVRVRFNALGHGLALAFFHPAEPGNYTVEVHHHHPLPREKRHMRRQYTSTPVGRVLVTVLPAGPPPPAGHPVPSCGPGPFAGRWVLLESACPPSDCVEDNAEVVNGSWTYAPYNCHLPLRWGPEVLPCLRGKWVLFHGDSTMEENAVGFVKDLLRGDTAMKKEKKGDLWRTFDVLVTSTGNVSHFAEGSRAWGNRSIVGKSSIRLTMRFNPTHLPHGVVYHHGDCDGLRTYTHHCNLTQELLEQFQAERPPDVFVFTSLQWDLFCVPLSVYSDLLQEIAGLFQALHVLSPGTLILFRGTYGSLAPYQGHPAFGVALVEQYLQAALDVMGRLPFVRVVDVYDAVQPWARLPEFVGDGLQPGGGG